MEKWDYIRLLSTASNPYGDLLLQLMDFAGCTNLNDVPGDRAEEFCSTPDIRKRMAAAAGKEQSMDKSTQIRAMRYIPGIAPHQIYTDTNDIALQSAVGGEIGRLELQKGVVMIYDADGIKHNRPINENATEIMRRTYPCSQSSIRGTVLIVCEDTRTDPVDGSDIKVYTHWDHGGRPPIDPHRRR